MTASREEYLRFGGSERRDVDKTVVLRGYQKELTSLGVKQNIIVCLPTGSGKTMIAVSVMNSPEFQHEVRSEGKKIVFIVTTVQLAVQQAAYIEKFTSYKVLLCTSDSTKSKSWTLLKWKQEIESHQVLVMIAQLCFDKILQDVLNFHQMAMLILDECHHAANLHVMNEAG
ncbi:unnamed protein product [Allacma fusca]|uniref:Helicase ATP-binding domain-containing protein n=1 Tax=Allacma fusca TaxID=39272 RepID=A0A8J2J4Q8_9HEXA|nr:unnamed protein product [Allacma fusca]